MKIALAQIEVEKHMKRNLGKAIVWMREAARMGARLICFPELQFSPYFPQFPKRDASQYVLHRNHKIIKTIQKECRQLGIAAVLNCYLKEGLNTYSASPVINTDGAIMGISKKVHIVQVSPFHEQDYFTPSDTGFHVYSTAYSRIGIVICYDRHYPESIRSCTLKGAEIIVIPTGNCRDEPLEKYEWELKIPAMQNSVFIAMCNRVGAEHKMHFCGESIILDPNGDVVAKADHTEQLLYADLELDMIHKTRKERPYLELRRAEFCTLEINGQDYGI